MHFYWYWLLVFSRACIHASSSRAILDASTLALIPLSVSGLSRDFRPTTLFVAPMAGVGGNALTFLPGADEIENINGVDGGAISAVLAFTGIDVDVGTAFLS